MLQVKAEIAVSVDGGALPECRTVPLSRALSREGEPVPIVQHQHVLVLPRPRLRSCRHPLHAAPASGRYSLPRPVLDCEAYPQIFLRELRDALQEQGVEVSTSSLSRFFARHAITRKKGRRTRLSRSGRT